MNKVANLLEGLKKALEVERELGVRSIEVDRRLLGVLGAKPVTRPRPTVSASPVAPPPRARPTPRVAPSPVVEEKPKKVYDFVFLHDKPLSPKGVEMVTKILIWMKQTPESAPLIVAPPLPRAKILVVLGSNAMHKYFPELRGEPGQWFTSSTGEDVLITYSPEHVLRFEQSNPASFRAFKRKMMQGFKVVQQRLGRTI